MALLKELFAKIKENDISFSRGEVDADPEKESGDEVNADELIPGADIADEVGDEYDADSEEGEGMGEEEEDVIGFDVPTFIKVLEWAHEEAQSDDDLHEMTEKLLALDTDFITMEDFEECCGGEEGEPEEGEPEGDGEMAGPEGEMGGEAPPMNPENDALTGM